MWQLKNISFLNIYERFRSLSKYLFKQNLLNNLMTYCLGSKKNRKMLLKVNNNYFSKIVLHNGRNKAMVSL